MQRPCHVGSLNLNTVTNVKVNECVTYVLLSCRINMYSEGLMDLMEMIMVLPFAPDVKEKLENIENKAKTRYLPVFEKVSVLLFRFLTNQTDPN